MRQALKIAIIRSGQTGRSIARKLGMSENRFSDIVQDWTWPRDDEREAIAAVLGQPADELFGPRQVAPAGRLVRR